MRRRVERVEGLFWLLGLAVLMPYVLTSFALDDELLALSHGLRLISGQVIYRDFFEFAAPLSRWLVGWIFLVTGPSLLAARVVQAGLLLVAGRQLMQLGRTLGLGPKVALLLGLTLLLAVQRLQPGYNHHLVVLPFLLGALQCALAGLESGRPAPWAAAGALTALTALVLQSDGLALMGALAGGALLGAWVMGRSRLAPAWLGAWALGLALPLALTALYFAWQGALAVAWYDVWGWTLTNYKTAGGINDVKFATDLPVRISPFSDDWVNLPHWYLSLYHWLFVVALGPLVAVGVLASGLGLLWTRLKGREASLHEAQLALAGLVALAMVALAVRGRADVVHAAMYLVPALLMFTLAAEQLRRTVRTGAWRRVGQLPLGGLVLFSVAGNVMQAYEMRRYPDQWFSAVSPDARLRDSPAIRWLKAHARPGDTLVAVPWGGYYYFYGLPPATTHSIMLNAAARYYSEAEVAAFWADVARTRPRFVLFDKSSLPFLEHSFPGPPAGYRLAAKLPSSRNTTATVYIYERPEPPAIRPPT